MSEPHSGPNPPGLSPYRAPTPRKRPAWRTFLWIVLAVAAAFFVAFLLTPHDGTGAGKGPPGGGAGGPGGPPGMGGPPGGGPGGGPPGAGGGGRRGATVVGVATAQKGDIDIQLTALGTVTPPATVTVRARIAGVLTKVLYKEGQTVKAGQLLAQVDDRPYVIALQQDEGQLLKDQAVLANARLDLERYRTLAAQDSVAKQTLDAQISTVKQAEGTVKTDQAAIASARLNIEYCHITAPISGRVGLRQVDVGNYVTTGDTNGVVVINQIDPIDVVFSLPEDNVPQIQARVAKGAVLKAVALDRAGLTALAQGSLSTLDNQIDTTTGTVKAKARFDNASGALYPNQFVNVRLLVDTAKDVVVVPTQAVRHGSQGDFVYTVDLDQNAKMVLVKVGPVDGERSAILSGVQVGDMVITDGGDRLRDGGHVILPGQAEDIPKAKPAKKGFFAWLSGLFGKKDKAAGAASGAPGSTASGEAPASGGAAGQGGGRGGGMRLQAMVADLNLTPDQQAQARTIFADMRAKAAAAGDDQAARHAAMQQGFTQFAAILTPEQKTKFEAARAKMRPGGGAPGAPGGAAGQVPSNPAGVPGSQASASPESAPPAPRAPGGQGGPGGGPGGRMAMITEALNLDADQKAKAQAIFAEARAKGEADPEARHAAMQEAMTRLAAILRPDQKAKLADLRSHMAGPPGGGPGGGPAQ